jgi:hypothetical protein
VNVADFLFEAANDRRPWNCSTLPADWCLTLGHPDFAAGWRETIEETECQFAAAAGLVALWNEGIGDALPAAPDNLRAGDIAVISRLGLEAGAIFDGERWALRTARGLIFAMLPGDSILKAWRP